MRQRELWRLIIVLVICMSACQSNDVVAQPQQSSPEPSQGAEQSTPEAQNPAEVESQPPNPPSGCVVGEPMINPPEFPDEMLLQVFYYDREGSPGGYRVYADGRFERLPREEEWQPGPPLSGEELTILRTSLSSPELFALEDSYVPRRSGDDTTSRWLQFRSEDGQTRSIYMENPCRVPEIDSLYRTLQTILAR